MTDENFRGQGLSRYLMEKIIDEYKDKVDGIYFFMLNSIGYIEKDFSTRWI